MNLAALKAAVAPAAILKAVSKAEVGERGASERDGKTKRAIVASNLKQIIPNFGMFWFSGSFLFCY